MKRYFFWIALVSSSHFCNAQTKFFTGGGVGSYAMGDMKNLQQDIANQFPVTPQVTSAFPLYYTFEIGGLIRVHRGPWLGINLGHCSTGGRVSYKDYSGTLRVDQIVSNYSIGIPIQFQLCHNEANTFLAELMPTAVLGRLDIKTFSQVGSIASDQVQSFRENDVGFQPAMILEKRIGKVIWCYIKTGYYFQIASSRLNLDSNHNYYLLNSQNKEAHLDWLGVRVSGGLTFQILK